MSQTKVLTGDAVELIPSLGKFALVFADPPFNIGAGYANYNDARPDFDSWLLSWINACWEACDGVLCLHGPDDLADQYLYAARVFGMPRVTWIQWHYRFGQCSRTNWIDSRCHCLVFGREQYVWNPDDVLVDSDRVKYGDPRVHDTDRGGKRLPGTVWGVPSDGPHWGRIQGNNAERMPGRPNQLPEKYLERLIRAYTNEGDRVLDPFGGTGTTAVVCRALNRECVTIDIDPDAVDTINERLVRGAVRVRSA